MKRIISMLLILCLVMGLAPAALAADVTTEGTKIVYDIGSHMGVYGDTSVQFSSMTYEKTGGLWEYYSNSANLLTADKVNFTYFGPSGLQFGNGAWFAMKINIPASGRYKGELSHGKIKSRGGKLSVYIIPADEDISSVINSGSTSEVLGEVSCAGGTQEYYTWGNVSDLQNIRELSAGEYYLVYKHTWEMHAAAGNLTLYTVDENGAKYAKYESAYLGAVSVDKTELKVGETATASAVVSDSITHEAITGVTYTSSNNAVATVDASGKVTAKAPGKTTISAKVNGYATGNVIGKEIEVKVAEDTSVGTKIVYDIGDHMGAYGDTSVQFSSMTYEKTGGLWEYYSNSANLLTADKVNFTYFGPSGLQFGNGAWFAMKINIPASGRYKGELSHGKIKSRGGKLSVYIIPADEDISSVINSGSTSEVLGEVSCAGGTQEYYTWGNVSDLQNIRELSAGEYYLVYKHTWEMHAAAGNLTLYTVDENGAKYAKYESAYLGAVSVDKTELKVGETATASAVVSDSITHEAITGVTYTSSNNAVATVDAITGKITAIKKGSATISANYTSYSDATVSIIGKNITVTEAISSGVTIEYDLGSYMGGWNDTSTLFSSFTYERTGGFWQYAANSTGGNTINRAYINYRLPYGLQLMGAAWFAIKIYVPEDGRYTAKVRYGEYQHIDEKFDVYMFPADEGVTAASGISGSNFIGSVTANETPSDVVWSENYVKTLTDKNLSAGEYYVVFKHTGGQNAFVGNFILDGGNEKTVPMKLIAESEKKRIKENESTSISYELYMNDGAKATDAILSYVSETPGTASVTDAGVVKGLAPGTAKISVTAKKGGTERNTSIDIEVADKDVSDVYIEYDIGSYMGGWNDTSTLFSSFTYERTGGFWQYAANSTGGNTINRAYINYRLPYGLQLMGAAWFAIKINVPKSGVYTPKVRYGEFSQNDEKFEVYLFNTDEVDAVNSGIVSENRIGTVVADKTPSAVIWSDDLVYSFEEKKLTAGEYYVVYKHTGGQNAFAGNFILDGGTDKVVMGAKLVVEGWVANVKAAMSDGTLGEFANVSARFASSDSTVAEINERTGKLYPRALGNVDITASIEADGKNYSALLPFEVTEIPLNHSGVKEEYDFITRSSRWNLEVNPNKDAIRDGDIRNITYQYTAEDGNGNWEYHSVGSTTGDWTALPSTFNMYNGTGIGGAARLQISLWQNQWVAFTLKVPKAGLYSVTMNYTVYPSSAGAAGIYIMPKSVTNINSALTTENYYGSIDFRDTTVSDFTIRETRLSDITIPEAGEYILVLKQNRITTDDYLRPRKLILDGVNSMREMTVRSNKTEIVYEDVEITDANKAQISVSAKRFDRTELFDGEYTVSYKSLDNSIASVDENGLVTAYGDGVVEIEVTATDGIETLTKTIAFTVIDKTGIKETDIRLPNKTLYIGETAKITFFVTTNRGNVVSVPIDNAGYSYSNSGIVEGDGAFLKGVAEGESEVSISVDFRGDTFSASETFTVIPDSGKTAPTYYTYEKREIAAENIVKYSWAKSQADSTIDEADKIVQSYDHLYSIITGEGVPRARQIGNYNDTEYNLCRYCGENIVGKYGYSGVGGWVVDPVRYPWKVQCPDCKRLFPSNDFESFYKLGLDEKGYFSRDRAYEKHKELFAEEYEASGGANQGYGYLKNDLYPELYNPKSESYNLDPLKKVWVDGTLWAVDDSMGYVPLTEDGKERRCSNNVIERHGYVALYNMTAWFEISNKVKTLAEAYVYTGDAKYGRAGAILLDRMADFYSSFDLKPYHNYFLNTHGLSGLGGVIGCIEDCPLTRNLAMSADAFWPILGDHQVINYLSKKAEGFGLENTKDSSKKIWDNWADNILKHSLTMAKEHKMHGNFGQAEEALAMAAVVLDNEPNSQEILDWIYKTGGVVNGTVTGSNLASQLIDVICRDGCGDEGSPYYNGIWSDSLISVAEILSLYDGKGNYGLYDNPKFVQMFLAPTKFALVDTQHAQIGDSGAVAGLGFQGTHNATLATFRALKDTVAGPALAKYIYLRSGYDVKGLNYGIFAKNPESAESDILSFISAPPEAESGIMTGFGFAALRAGRNYLSDTSATAKNNLRDFWMYFGGANTSHGHYDTLGLGVEAYGLNLAPEMGYPQNTGNDPNRLQWVEASISHNLVLVDEKNQDSKSFFGTPLHFEDSGRVKVMDVDGNGVYENTDIYRRTIVMVEANDDVSYGVDFFRVLGGDAHTFSFHAQGENATPVSGLEMTKQADADGNYIGTYAGPDTEYGRDPHTGLGEVYQTLYPRGYTWMTKVRRDNEPENNFAVDFEITDYRKAIADSKGLRLRMTQMNDFTPDEVAIVAGMVPVKTANKQMPDAFDYVLVQRRGENLDSLFTTVYEPYKTNRYLESIEPCEVTGEITGENVVKAVRVEHTSGRVDYVVYATDNTKTYRVADLFDFRGFVGVYSVNAEGEVIYRYVNDGDIIGDATEKPASYSGTVADFQTELSLSNYIDVNMDCEDVLELAGKCIYVENDGVQNGVYYIENAQSIGDGKVRLDIGTISLIRGHKDKENFVAGYVYNIKEGQTFSIPSTYVDDPSPEFKEMNKNLSTSAGSSISIAVKAFSPIEQDAPSIEYVGTTLPRGATLDAASGAITWKPTSSQVGDSHFAITARDEDGRESTIHFTVTVYGSTGGGSGGGSGSSGSTGNSGTSTPTIPATKPDDKDNTTGSTDNVGDGVLDVPQTPSTTERFIDLGNHAWAKDAINSLADEGIIKGTSENTFSPAANITRADFTILLVRAFKLESENTENFADVAESDYFAKELAIARNTGIVNGIGDNKYAPRNTITRQDMMTIVYRAITALEVEFESYDEPQYEDFANVAEYAKDAVKTLVGAGLVNGKSGKIAPSDYTTRAEVAVLLKRILDYIG